MNYQLKLHQGSAPGDYLLQWDIAYNKTLDTLVRSVENKGERAVNTAKLVAAQYANSVMNYRSRTLGSEALNLDMVGWQANAYGSSHGSGFGCSNFTVSLLRDLNRIPGANEFFDFDLRYSAAFGTIDYHTWPEIKVKHNNQQWVLTAWDNGTPGLVEKGNYSYKAASHLPQ